MDLQINRPITAPIPRKGGSNSRYFGWIADGRAGSVSFNISGEFHVQARFSISVSDQLLLGAAAWLCDTCSCPTVLIGGGRTDNCTYRVSIP